MKISVYKGIGTVVLLLLNDKAKCIFTFRLLNQLAVAGI